MAEEEKRAETDILIRCPACGTFVMRGRFEGRTEVNCKGGRCGAVLEVSIHEGRPTVTVMKTKA